MSAQDKDLALAIRTCKADGTSYNGFAWPSTEGAEVRCPDWNPKAECGNGLHALLDGWGYWGLMNSDMDARWQIVEVKRSECVDIENKVKFPRCKLVYSGDMATAMTKISKWQIGLLINATQNNADLKDCKPDSNNAQIGSSGYSAKIGSSGYSAQIGSSGYSAKIGSSGDSAQIGSSGDSAQIGSSGYSAKIGSSGNSAQIGSSRYSAKIGSSGYSAKISSSGDSAQIGSSGYSAQIGSSGYSAQIGSSGDYAQIGSSGYSAQIGSSGNSAQIGSSGDYAQIGSSGNYAKIEAKGKDAVVAAAGSVASFMLGENGCAAIPYHDGTRTRFFLAYVGENCAAGVRYAVNGKGELIPA